MNQPTFSQVGNQPAKKNPEDQDRDKPAKAAGWVFVPDVEHPTPTLALKPSARPTAILPRCHHSSLDPNGNPWPASSGYLFGHEDVNSGSSDITIDNVKNDSDTLVKVYDHKFDPPSEVLIFLVRARQKFSADRVPVGNYDLRYLDLDSCIASKSEVITIGDSQTNIITVYKKLNPQNPIKFLPIPLESF